MVIKLISIYIVFLIICKAAAASISTEIEGMLEGGVGIGIPGPPASKFMVDTADLKITGHVSEKVKIVVDNVLAVSSTAGHVDFDARNYWGNNLLRNNGLTLANIGAFVDYHWSDLSEVFVGYARVPFGMEFLKNRFDMHSYYYSSAIVWACTLGWAYDLGVGFKFKDLVPGFLELSVLDGRQLQGEDIPTLSMRWHLDLDLGNMTLTPIASTYIGGLPPGPDPVDDGGFTLGLQWKMDKIWANTEFLMVIQDAFGTRYNAKSLYFETGMNVGNFGISTKVDFSFLTVGNSEMVADNNLALVVSDSFDQFRIRLAGMLANLRTSPLFDLRLLFGTAW